MKGWKVSLSLDEFVSCVQCRDRWWYHTWDYAEASLHRFRRQPYLSLHMRIEWTVIAVVICVSVLALSCRARVPSLPSVNFRVNDFVSGSSRSSNFDQQHQSSSYINSSSSRSDEPHCHHIRLLPSCSTCSTSPLDTRRIGHTPMRTRQLIIRCYWDLDKVMWSITRLSGTNISQRLLGLQTATSCWLILIEARDTRNPSEKCHITPIGEASVNMLNVQDNIFAIGESLSLPSI